MPIEGLFVAIGHKPNTDVFREQLAVDDKGYLVVADHTLSNIEGVFVAGDLGGGQCLIVWAIADGRSAAAGVVRYLLGETKLPEPIPPTARPLM